MRSNERYERMITVMVCFSDRGKKKFYQEEICKTRTAAVHTVRQMMTIVSTAIYDTRR